MMPTWKQEESTKQKLFKVIQAENLIPAYISTKQKLFKVIQDFNDETHTINLQSRNYLRLFKQMPACR